MKKWLTALLLLIGFGFMTLTPQMKAEAATSEELVTISKKYIGTPYRFGGTSPGGFDCSGYIYYIFREAGISLPRVSADQAKVGQTVSKADLQPGDLVFFANTYKSGISHSGMYIGNNQFIGASSSKGVTIESMNHSYWGPKFSHAKRVPRVKLDDSIFSDVRSKDPIYEAISSLNSESIITGYSNGTFKPNDSVTRGQAAAIINRALKLPASPIRSFNDVSNSNPFANDIAAIEQAGIITGFADSTFRPNEPMTRAQMAVIVQRAYELNNADFSIAGSVYNDVPASYWAHDAINLMNKIDQTSVYKTNSYRAISNATRADFSVAIYNAMNYK